MKQFVIAVTAMAAIAISTPLSAQPAQPAPASPPPSGAAAPAPPVQSMNRMPAGGRATSERGQTGSVTRAHHRRHSAHGARQQSTGAADQLNRQELTNIQSGNPAQGAAPGGNPTTLNRMPAGGRATSGSNRQ